MAQLALSPAGIAHVKKWEGLRLTAYLCTAGVWTIGWGATGAGIRQGTVWTREHAELRFAADIAQFSREVAALLKTQPEQREFDVMVSLAFNVGIGAFRQSTLLKKFNRGDRAGAGLELPRWNIAGGKVDRGLVNRRAAELAIWQSATEAEPDPDTGRASVAAPSVIKSGSALAGSAVAALAMASQAVQHVDAIADGVRGLGLSPAAMATAAAALITAAAVVVIWRAVQRRRG